MDYPALPDPNAYAFEVGGDALRPIYRAGDIIVVSPAAALRRGDRVVARSGQGEIMVREYLRQSDGATELLALSGGGPALTLAAHALVFVHRIVWVSQ